MKQLIGIAVGILMIAICFYGIAYQVYINRQIDSLETQVVLSYQTGIEHGRQEERAKAMEYMERYREQIAEVLNGYEHCDDPDRWAAWIMQYAYAYKVPSIILLGKICQESSCNAEAVSSCGAVGLTQIRWRFWSEFLQEKGIAYTEKDLFDPETSIQAGAAILSYLIERYGDLQGALQHYSGGAQKYFSKIIARATKVEF
jgi:soluble lytic murein transglycosylase-like protein